MMNFFSKKPSMKCPKCGFPVLPKHIFCPKCGHALTDEAQQQVEEQNKAQRETWEEEFEVEKKRAQFDFDQKQEQQKSAEEQELRKIEHQQEMAERDAQRCRDQQQLDFDLEQRKEELSDERSFKRDEHSQTMTDRDTQRSRDQKQFDFELQRAEKTADMEAKQQEKQFDFDLEVQKQEKADEHVLRMEEHEMKMASHEQDMADREAQRRMEELKLKGSIAMQNMQAMMDAKRAARQDDFEAEERRMQTQKEMTAEQIMAAQIREMDAEAQAKFAESFSAGKDAAREREVAEEKVQMQQQMMQQMTEMAKMGFQANATVATGKIDALREGHAAAAPTSPPVTPEPEKPKPIRLNTSWLREHGYEGSFNELAGYLHNLGAGISQDYDNQGNPVIVVEGLNQAQVTDVLEKSGVKF